jgi:hypothetical protein
MAQQIHAVAPHMAARRECQRGSQPCRLPLTWPSCCATDQDAAVPRHASRRSGPLYRPVARPRFPSSLSLSPFRTERAAPYARRLSPSLPTAVPSLHLSPLTRALLDPHWCPSSSLARRHPVSPPPCVPILSPLPPERI